jgi:hypothetical protein
MVPRQARGFHRFLLLSVSFLVGFFVRNLMSNDSDYDTPIIVQEPSNLTLHCQTFNENIEQSSTPTPKSTEQPSPGGVHTYLPNGLLLVNPDASHPILELIRNAEEEWQKKLDKSSRTLEDAVREYKRRYKRAPPQGFDDW